MSIGHSCCNQCLKTSPQLRLRRGEKCMLYEVSAGAEHTFLDAA